MPMWQGLSLVPRDTLGWAASLWGSQVFLRSSQVDKTLEQKNQGEKDAMDC